MPETANEQTSHGSALYAGLSHNIEPAEERPSVHFCSH